MNEKRAQSAADVLRAIMIERALIRSRQCPGMFFRFARPDGGCQGRDFSDLQEAVSRTATSSSMDDLAPPGAWVGYVTYEGDFSFSHFGRVESVEAGNLLPHPLHPPVELDGEAGWASSVDEAAYEAMVLRAQEYIRSGDIYQVNLCRLFERETDDLDAMSLFQGLWQITEAPMAACLEWEGGALLSASPELFLAIEGRHIQTSPIKGTRPRDPIQCETGKMRLSSRHTIRKLPSWS
jgi:hypothetical protein